MNKKILIICSQYANDASGICIQNISKVFLKQGALIYVISEKKQKKELKIKTKGIKIFYIKSHGGLISNKKRTIGRVIRLVKSGFSTFTYPNVAPIRSRKIIKLSKQLIKENSIDCVIGVYRPYEAIKAVIKLKKIFKEKIKAITYHLDLIQEPSNTSKIIRKYKIWRGRKALDKELKMIDMMLAPESAEKILRKNQKVKYVDFPLYIKDIIEKNSGYEFSNEFINLSYVGSLDENNRNPKYALELFNEYNKKADKKIKLHIWGNLFGERLLALFDKYDFICYNGIIENSFVQDVLKRSDFLLNISNKITFNMVPSKIFQMFCVKKPVINFISNENDYSIRYYDMAKNSLNITEYEKDLQRDLILLQNNIINYVNKFIDIDDELFIKSTPEYTVNLINDCVTEE